MRPATFLSLAFACLSVEASPYVAIRAEAPAGPALSEGALTKVLDDAHEVWGTPRITGRCTTKPSRAEWMKAFADNTPLASLNIPGTHDTATWNYSLATQDALRHITRFNGNDLRHPLEYRCHWSSIAASLEAGVRFFDLRYAFDPTDTYLVFWHNEALVSQRSRVDDVLFAFWDWLDAHPSETVLLSFMYQGRTKAGASHSAAVQTQLFDMLTSETARNYILQHRGDLGTLGRARGKAVLIRRFTLDKLDPSYDAALPGLHLAAGWDDNGKAIELVYNSTTGATAYIEDYYSPSDLPADASTTVNIEAKVNVTAAHLEKAATEAPESLFITFASGGRLDATPPVYPETMAVGNGTQVTPRGGVNHQLVPVLESLKGKRKGVVMLDFFEEPKDLVELILDL